MFNAAASLLTTSERIFLPMATVRTVKISAQTMSLTESVSQCKTPHAGGCAATPAISGDSMNSAVKPCDSQVI